MNALKIYKIISIIRLLQNFPLDCLGESKLSNPASVAVSTAPGLYWISLGWQHQAHRSLQVSTNFELKKK